MAPLSVGQTVAGIVGWFIGMINLIIPVLVALALVLFLYAGYRYAAKAEDVKSKSPERDALLWGLIALFVIVSVWGILRLMCNTLTGSSSCQPGANSTGVRDYFGTTNFENNSTYGGPR